MRKSQKCRFGLSEDDLDGMVRPAEADWRELKGARLFLTGGTGFFGKWLLAAFAHANENLDLDLDVAVLSRDPARFLARYPDMAAHPGFRFERGNVADFSRLAPCDFVLHGASDTTAFTSATQEDERSRTIVEGTRRMLELTRQGGARRLLFVSSGAVYGAAAGRLSGAREEDAETAVAVTDYGRAKLEAERLCRESELDFVTARAFAFLGPHLALDAHFAAGNFLRDAHAGGPILVRGDGTALRSYLYPADLVVWLLRLLVRGARGRAYNVGSDETVTTAELARRIASACRPAPEVIIQSQQPHGPQNIYLPDLARARAELELDVGVRLDEAIRRTLDFVSNGCSSGTVEN